MDWNEELNSGLAQHQAGNLPQAEAIYRQILSQNPNQPDALHLLGVIAMQSGQSDTAMVLIKKAIKLKPEHAEAHNNLGHILVGKSRFEESVGFFQRAIKLNPDLVVAHCNLGNALRNLGRLDEAIVSHERAIRIKPDYPEAHNDLAIALMEKDRLAEAVAAFERAIQINPDVALIHYNLGNTLMALFEFDRAMASFERAIQLSPDFAEALNNLGCALQAKCQVDQAIVHHQRAIQLKPDLANAHHNLGMAYLKIADFKRGWAEYEWRWKSPELPPAPKFSQPRWDGTSANGRTILLFAEQGFGDSIQFIRYAPRVAQLASRVILRCPPELSRLLQTVPGIQQVITNSDSLPHFDLQCPLMTLPLIFSTELHSIPSQIPYLTPDPALTRQCKDRLTSAAQGFKVGLAWAGSPKLKGDRLRSIALQQLSPLLEIPGYDFISLQKNDSASTPRNLIDWTADLHDFADTAALIANLDLVIAVDTAVAHLAGALGKPVWVLLPFAADWRWMQNRGDSPWYPTMRLFRQTKHGDWSDPINSVVSALRTR